ncbi:MAG: phytoene desaturase family protein [Pseudomonadota bacterium]
MATLEASTIRIGRRYRPNRLAEQYDAVIIGSGIGGLTSAALLSELGWKVCVLEQHYTAGGYTHSYDRNGYEWDVGVHYIGDVGAQTTARRLFDFISGGQLQWAPMDPEYDRFYIGNQVYSALAGRSEFRANLVARFPREEKAIDRYLELLDTVGRAMPVHTMMRLLRPWQRRLASPFLKHKTPELLYRTTWDVLTGLTQDRDLIAVLCGQWGDMGLPPKKSAFMVHALIARHYLYGGYYPVGGSWRIAETIIPQIRKSGGEVFTYARVQRILVEDGRAGGVEMEDGTRIACDCVISSAGVLNTFRRLLPAAMVAAAGYDRELAKVRPSAAHLGVYIGLKGTAAELGLPKTNFWIYPDNDYDASLERFWNDRDAPFPVVYISFPSAKDPDYERRRPGTSTIEIVAPAPFEWFERWKDTPWGKRGEDYDAFKSQLGERLMAHLYEKMPQLRGKVDYYEVSTPLSTDYFCAYARGELYGIDHDPQRFRQDWLAPRTKIPGLWLTGQDVVSCGVVGAMMAGMLTTTAIVGVRRSAPLMKRILAGRPQKAA